MPRLQNFGQDPNVTLQDRLLGAGSEQGITYTYTLRSIFDRFQQEGITGPGISLFYELIAADDDVGAGQGKFDAADYDGEVLDLTSAASEGVVLEVSTTSDNTNVTEYFNIFNQNSIVAITGVTTGTPEFAIYELSTDPVVDNGVVRITLDRLGASDEAMFRVGTQLHLQIIAPAGTQGADGEQGDQGIGIVDGQTATITAGGGTGEDTTFSVALNDPSGDTTPDPIEFTVPAGAQGEQGLPGEQGMPGPQGDPGAPGMPGADGPPGPAGADSTVPGPEGDSLRIVNLNNGDQNTPTTFDIETVNDAGVVVDTDNILISQGPAGPTGATGEPGPQGMMGLPGTNGMDGMDGMDGMSVTIYYADDAAGSNPTTTRTNQEYIGFDIHTAGTDPQPPSTWDKFVGEDGMNGTNGMDGAQGREELFAFTNYDADGGGSPPTRPTGGDQTTPPTSAGFTWAYSGAYMPVDGQLTYISTTIYDPANPTATLTWSTPYEATGATGPQGATGNPGMDGAAAAFGDDPVTVNTLAAGQAATGTVTGGAQSMEFTFGIPRGATGATGMTGMTGDQGPQGREELFAFTSVADATAGDALTAPTGGSPTEVPTGGGATWAYSNSFTPTQGQLTYITTTIYDPANPTATLTWVDPYEASGAAGPQGAAGNPGMDGMDGASAAFGPNPVTVNTLAAGTPATGRVDGGAQAMQFTFGIPRGATGAAGADGMDGAAGADGADGDSVDIALATNNDDENYRLVITETPGDGSDATTITTPNLIGPQGPQGDPGTPGSDAARGFILVNEDGTTTNIERLSDRRIEVINQGGEDVAFIRAAGFISYVSVDDLIPNNFNDLGTSGVHHSRDGDQIRIYEPMTDPADRLVIAEFLLEGSDLFGSALLSAGLTIPDGQTNFSYGDLVSSDERIRFIDNTVGSIVVIESHRNLTGLGSDERNVRINKDLDGIVTARVDVTNLVNEPTNLGTANRDGDSIDITSSTGTNATIESANTIGAGLMSAADKSKLDGIETGADVTDSDNVTSSLVSAINISAANQETIRSNIGAGTSSVDSIDDLSDVDTSTTAPTDGQFLRWNADPAGDGSEDGEWQNQTFTLPGGGLTTVATDDSITGDGTTDSPLSVDDSQIEIGISQVTDLQTEINDLQTDIDSRALQVFVEDTVLALDAVDQNDALGERAESTNDPALPIVFEEFNSQNVALRVSTSLDTYLIIQIAENDEGTRTSISRADLVTPLTNGNAGRSIYASTNNGRDVVFVGTIHDNVDAESTQNYVRIDRGDNSVADLNSLNASVNVGDELWVG